ncbi:glutathione S-transferase family protein [Ruegeria halocynthiae]|uniref:glutathione S-transferase family protein n=1 Tax=Ruegeria halocynthiae TaxID=985054 RepID=UPI00068E4C7B|nr:glutathione S-transferase N-terminal domain-containing protein [Ruegeria halocynthiae]
MPEIDTKREHIRALEGVHLFHFSMSTCSQRVRMTATEKGVDWTSHHIDLGKNEHLSPDFVGVNPNGLVPVFVHGGRTFIESNDIIAYLDVAFPCRPLTPENSADATFVADAIASADEAQGAIKLLSHEFLFKPKVLKSPREFERFSRECPNPSLIYFRRGWLTGPVPDVVLQIRKPGQQPRHVSTRYLISRHLGSHGCRKGSHQPG